MDRRKFKEQRYFEDFEIGETFYIASRTQTSGIFAAFQAASGDNHPIHYDGPMAIRIFWRTACTC
jgi:acyl dehydratase